MRRFLLLAFALLLGLAVISYWPSERHGNMGPLAQATEPGQSQPLVAPSSPSKPPHQPSAGSPPTAPALSIPAASPEAEQKPKISPLPENGNSVPLSGDRYAEAEVLERRGHVDLTTPGQYRQSRLLRWKEFKYPLVVVHDEIEVPQEKGGQPKFVRQRVLVADHVVIKPKPGLTDAKVSAVLAALGAMVRKKMPASGIWLVSFPKATLDTVPAALRAITENGSLAEYAEPDYVVNHQLSLPNDTSFGSLWGMHNVAQNGGTADADIDAPEAWDLGKGSRDVLVGVIDTGIDYTHPDLAANMWVNPNEIAGNNIDDDANGYVDDIRGWDFCNNDSDPMDDNKHGTHCAGTIGAVGNNGLGVTGVCWQVSMVGLKFLNNSGTGATSDATEAIAYATQIGVDLTSNSWGGGGHSQALEEAINTAGAAGILFVAAAGNDAVNTDTSINYPSGYASGNIISVASTTTADTLSSFSNYGAATVDLAAPGTTILSTAPGGGYVTLSGTSMATPHVAGACALLKGINPSLNSAPIKAAIMSSIDPLPALSGRCVTGGRLNVFRAAVQGEELGLEPNLDLEIQVPLGGTVPSEAYPFTITNYSRKTVAWSVQADQNWLSVSGTSSGALSPSQSTSFAVKLNATDVGFLTAGKHVGTLELRNLSTGRVQTRRITLDVVPPPVYEFSLDTDPGWPRAGQWSYGVPTGKGGTSHGFPDPTKGFTGTNVLGVNLAGDYFPTPSGPHWVTAGPFDLSNYKQTRLAFQRWLNTDWQPWVSALIAVSTDGVSWTTIWSNGPQFITDNAWKRVEYDIKSLADGKSRVWVRWGYSVSSLSDVWACSGWNLDDIQILGEPLRVVKLVGPVEATEGDAPVNWTLTMDPPPDEAFTVDLECLPAGQIDLPPTLSLTAGQGSISLPISVVDDGWADGSQQVNVRATHPGWSLALRTFTAHDNESATLTLTVPAEISEDEPGALGSVALPAPAERPIVVSLSSENPGTISVPPTVTIAQGQTSADFSLGIVNNYLINPARTVKISASVKNWPMATANILFHDDEPHVLMVDLPPAIQEDQTGEHAGIVRLSGAVASPLTVTLSSADTSQLELPPTVTIPANHSSVSFALILRDEDVIDGMQQVQVTAMADGFESGSATAFIYDNETPALPGNPVPEDKNPRTSPSTHLAWDDLPYTGCKPALWDVYFGTTPEMALHRRVGSMKARRWSLGRIQRGVTYYWRIVARKGKVSQSSPVWSFTIPDTGLPVRYVWGPISPTQIRNRAFPVTLTGYDEFGNLATVPSGPLTITPSSPALSAVILPETVELTKGRWQGTVRFQDKTDERLYLTARDSRSLSGDSGLFKISSPSIARIDLSRSVLRVVESEGDTKTRFMVHLYPSPKAALKVTVTSQDQTELGTVAITVPAGKGQAELWAPIRDDTLIDGPQRVTLEAWAPGYASGYTTLDVLDNEANTLSLSLPGTVSEAASTVTGTVSLRHPVDNDVTVSLSDESPYLTVQTLVKIPKGETSANFSASVIQNNRLDLDRPVTIMASVVGWGSVSESITIIDDEERTISLSAPAILDEGSRHTFTLTLAAPPADALVIKIASSDYTEVRVPATVTIPSGILSQTFTIDAIDDTETDGTVPFTLTFQASGLTTLVKSLNAADNDAHHFEFADITAPVHAGIGKGISLTAKDINNQALRTVRGPVAISALKGVESLMCAFDPLAFSSTGTASTNVRIMGSGPSIRLRATGPSGSGVSSLFEVNRGAILQAAPNNFALSLPHRQTAKRTLSLSNLGTESLTWSVPAQLFASASPSSGIIPPSGTANVTLTFSTESLSPFFTAQRTLSIVSNDGLASPMGLPCSIAVSGAIHRLEWSSIASTQLVNSAFTATLTARDASGAVATNFEGNATLSGMIGPSSATPSILTFIGYCSDADYQGTIAAISRYFTDYTESSTTTTSSTTLASLLTGKSILLIPDQELASTGQMKNLGTSWSSTLSSFVNSGGTVILCSYADSEGGFLSAAGLMNYTAKNTPGTSSLRREGASFLTTGVPSSFLEPKLNNFSGSGGIISFAADGLYPVVIHRPVGLGTAIAIGTDFATRNDFMDRIIANAVQLTRTLADGPAPTTVGPFVNGVWSGPITSSKVHSDLKLIAAVGQAVGTSNKFDVIQLSTSSLSFATDLAENQGTVPAAGTLTVSTPPSSDLAFSLQTSATSQLSLPESVILPAGQTTVSFPVTVIDDTIFKGIVTYHVYAFGAGYSTAEGQIKVHDNEPATIVLTLPERLKEGDVSSGIVRMDVAPAVDTVVSLSSLSPRLSVPEFVLIRAGASSAPVTCRAVENLYLDPDEAQTVTLTWQGAIAGSASTIVEDNEPHILTITSSQLLPEHQWTAVQVTLGGMTRSAVSVQFSSSDASEISDFTVPIRANLTTGSTVIKPFDDTDYDGTQEVTLTARLQEIPISQTLELRVQDNDVHHYAFSAIGSSQVRNKAFGVVVSPRDINDTKIVPLTPPTLRLTENDSALAGEVLRDGISDAWNVTPKAFASEARVEASDRLGGAVSKSSLFVVSHGPATSIQWSPLFPHQKPDIPFSVSLTALDNYGNAVPTFSGPVSFALATGGEASVGNGPYSVPLILGVSNFAARFESIYLTTEINAPSSVLNAISMKVNSKPGQTLSNFTIRLKQTGRSGYSIGDSFDNSGWTTVFQAPLTVSNTGWVRFPFSAPVIVNPVQNLMVDISFFNSSVSYSGTISAHSTGIHRVYSASGITDPIDWTTGGYTSAVRPDLRFDFLPSGPATVTEVSGSFVEGTWTGELSVSPAITGANIIASSADVLPSMSPTFDAVDRTLNLQFAADTVNEGGKVACTVQVSPVLIAPFTVSLASSHPAQISTPAEITIPAGQGHATFEVTGLDDTLFDADLPITITASAGDLAPSAAGTITLKDNDG